MKNVFYLFTALLFIMGCSSNDVQEELVMPKEVPASFENTYEGTIDDKYEIVMKLSSNEGEVSGKYFYKSQGGDLTLSGELDARNAINLSETNGEDKQVGIFQGQIDGEQIVGVWSTPDGSKEMEFVLSESSVNYEVLQGQVKEKNEARNWLVSGKYMWGNIDDGEYGVLDVQKTGDRSFVFSIEMRDDSLMCGGDINGSVELDGAGKGIYEGEEGCQLTFTYDSERREFLIDEMDCEFWHGFRCNFIGMYTLK